MTPEHTNNTRAPTPSLLSLSTHQLRHLDHSIVQLPKGIAVPPVHTIDQVPQTAKSAQGQMHYRVIYLHLEVLD